MLPYWFNYKGGEEAWNKSQCLCAGANNWIPTQQALNGGLNNMWAQIDKPQSWGYFKREDLPYHFALADAYTVGDHNFVRDLKLQLCIRERRLILYLIALQAGITSNTNANRRFWEVGHSGLFVAFLHN